MTGRDVRCVLTITTREAAVELPLERLTMRMAARYSCCTEA